MYCALDGINVPLYALYVRNPHVQSWMHRRTEKTGNRYNTQAVKQLPAMIKEKKATSVSSTVKPLHRHRWKKNSSVVVAAIALLSMRRLLC
jgi:hypothetical protein